MCGGGTPPFGVSGVEEDESKNFIPARLRGCISVCPCLLLKFKVCFAAESALLLNEQSQPAVCVCGVWREGS